MPPAARSLKTEGPDPVEALGRAALALASGASIEYCLHVVAEEAVAVTGARGVTIGLFDERQECFTVAAAAGENAPDLRGVTVAAAQSLARHVLDNSEPTILNGCASTSALGYHTALVAPLAGLSTVVGAVIAIDKSGDGEFNQQDMSVLTTLANLAAVAHLRSEAQLAAARKSQELAMLLGSTRSVTGTLNLQSVLDSLLDVVCKHFEHQSAALFLFNDERSHLFIAADRGLVDDEKEVQLAAGDGAVAALLSDGAAVVPGDALGRNGGQGLALSERAGTAMIAPLRGRTEPLGLLVLTSAKTNEYTTDDIDLLAAVASQAGIAISNAWLYEDAIRQTEEAGALYDLSQHVNATLHLDRVLQFVADSVVNVLKVDKFALMLRDPRDQRLKTKVTRGLDDSFLSIRPKAGEGIPGWVFEWMTPTAVADVKADARNGAAPIHGAGITSAICVPMAVGDETIGVMLAMSSRRRFFTVAEMELLYTIANQAAVAIVNATLYRDARTKSVEMHRYFRRIAQAVASAFEAKDLAQLLADLVVEVMRADRCAIYRTEGETVKVQATSKFRPSNTPDVDLTIGDGLTGWVAKKGKPLIVTSLTEDTRTHAHPWMAADRLASYLAVPLKSGRKTVGVVEILTQEPRQFGDDEIRLLSQFARRAKVADCLTAGA